MTTTAAETHLVLVWDRGTRALDRILADARRRFVIHDVVRVTWSPHRFRRNLARLYGTDLPADSDKERECGTGPFVVVVVGDERPRVVARRARDGWAPANAALLAAKRRYRRWAGGAYRVHTTLTRAEATKDAVLVLGEPLPALGERTWDGTVRERRRDLLGDPGWASVDEMRAALAATMPATVGREDGSSLEVLTDDPWWAIRIVDPPAAEGSDPDERLRRPLVGGIEVPVLVRDRPDGDEGPGWTATGSERIRPRLADRLATLARRRA